jgi:hypothetical protein
MLKNCCGKVLVPLPSPAYCQGSEALSPVVIDVWPLPGMELIGRDPLTITITSPSPWLLASTANSVGRRRR